MSHTYDPFPAADLETNKGGRLTDDQRRKYANEEHSFRWSEMTMAMLFAAIAGILVFANGPSSTTAMKPLAIAGFGAVAAFLFIRSVFLPDKLTGDLRSGKVISIEGAIGKHRFSASTEPGSEQHFLDLNHQHFKVDGPSYEAAPDAGFVRLYYLPRSHRVVNLERLPDPPVNQAMLNSPTQFLSTMAAALGSHDEVRRAELRAEMAAVENVVKGSELHNAVTPPADQLDPRPLGQAILGTWKTPMMSMTFMPDGTVVATLPNGQRRQGKWSIGADGRLHSNATGRDEAVQAWVAGDTLSLSEDGQGFAFKRVN